MSTASLDHSARQEGCVEIRPLPAKDVLRLELRHIEVPAGSEVLLSPEDPEYAACFARVRLRSYEDLQTLGFVPRRLPEDRVRQALAVDDAEAYEFAGRMLQQSRSECACANGAAQMPSSRGSPLRTIYNRIRKTHNPALARVLSDHYNMPIAWDTAIPAIVRKWTLFLRYNPDVTVAALGDIIIHRNATLAVAATSKSLMAWNVWIHKTGRLVQQGSYLKLWANSISHFADFLDSLRVDAARKIAPIWTQGE